MRPVLVIGFGNSLRRDDGVGAEVAARVERWKQPGVRALACQQLTPELAEAISSAGLVVFVDAQQAGASGAVRARRLSASSSGDLQPHRSDLRALLALTRALFGTCPPAWLITIPVLDFGFGEQLSVSAERGVAAALRLIQKQLGLPRGRASSRGQESCYSQSTIS